ncbi:BlaI/MecI/CopY family transcriptional regulator [Rariglobus hedericola]|uniref:BlaI/MecI/CopY family transcriptional regulator n=2 Tax=Rariglobus hedericola TaxID=2597822 RepID=A0A556QSZ3_9BACT|nr:BlaI/MecI/CopY family transcriptional regulator [Rariglobus hedericola]
MSSDPLSGDLSKRERQVMEIIVRLQRATARDIEGALTDAPTYSAVRSILRILVNKGLVRKESADGRDWYAPSMAPATARTGALRAFVRNFFDNSAGEAACALLGQKNLKLSQEEADTLMKLIKEARIE